MHILLVSDFLRINVENNRVENLRKKEKMSASLEGGAALMKGF